MNSSVHIASVDGVSCGSPATGEKLPLRLANVQTKARGCLQELLARMFDHADDALFEMADRAGSNHEQNIYFESMRELRLRRREIELAYGQRFDAGFDQLAVSLREAQTPGQDSAGVAPASEVRFDKLSLVDESEIEERIAIESMVTRTLRLGADELSLLSMRFESLVTRLRVDNDNNPLSPQMICDALTGAYTVLDIDIKARLFILKLYEKYVLRELVTLYRSLNRDLAEEGVLPNISLADQAQRERGYDGEASRSAAQPEHRGAAEAGLGAEKDPVFSHLQSLLQQSQPVGGGAVGHKSVPVDVRGAVKIVRRSTVVDVLGTMQNAPPELLVNEQGYVTELPPLLDLHQLVEQKLNEKGGEGRYELGREDEDAINIVTLMFRFVIADDNLALPLKSQLSLLQVPIVKVALLDKSFFGKKAHPAKKLFNLMARAGIGWEAVNNASRDFFYRKLSQSVKTVLSRFDDDLSVFQEVLADFTAFLENERRRASVVEQRTLEAEKGRARAEASRQGVAAAIERCTAGKYLPAVVADLIEHAWSKVLFLLYARDGETSESWKSAVQVMEELVWSVQPKPGEAERCRLQRLAPHLLKSIRVGLSRVGFSYFAMNHFFEQLEVIHRCSLERSPSPSPAAAAEEERVAAKKESNVAAASTRVATSLDALLSGEDGADGADGAPIAVSEADPDPAGGKASASPEQPSAAQHQRIDEEALLLVDGLTTGSWIQYQQSDQVQFRCRLAAVMKPVDKYIFINRSGKKVAEWSRQQLAAKVSSDVVVLLDDRLLFDRALESVIAQLRSERR